MVKKDRKKRGTNYGKKSFKKCFRLLFNAFNVSSVLF